MSANKPLAVPGDHYVVICERDCDEAYLDRYGWMQVPHMIVMETILPTGSSLEAVQRHRAGLGTRFGRTRIARLVLVEDPQ
jgi:hypothetical protein